jgi:tetratricopeptide (TPR) repeat protein
MAELDDAEIDKFWDYDQPADSERRFRGLLPSVAAGSSAHVALLTQVARAQGLQRNFEGAHATLDEAQSLLGEGMHRARARYLLERGRALNSGGQAEQARPRFREAWEIAAAAGEDFYAVDAAHMLGICETPEQQMAWNRTAMALAERTADARARGWLGPLYNNMGWTLHDQGDYTGALELFEKGEDFRAAQGQAKELLIARWCVARCLRSLGRVEEALARQQQLWAAHQAAGTQDGYVLEELGECLLALGRGDEARPYFGQAYGALAQDPWLRANEAARLERLRTLGA